MVTKVPELLKVEGRKDNEAELTNALEAGPLLVANVSMIFIDNFAIHVACSGTKSSEEKKV